MLIKAFGPLLGLMEKIGEKNGVGGALEERLRKGVEIVINMKTLVQTFHICPSVFLHLLQSTKLLLRDL